MEIGSLLLSQRFAVPIVPYTEANLHEDLAQGVGNVLAGVGSDFRLDVSADTGSVLLRHKDVNTAGLGAGYTGAVRTALGITASGIIAGYNRLSDGAWVNSLVIDGTTGSATFTGAINATSGNFTGTVTAGSIISGDVTVSGATMLTIKNQAAAGATAVQPAAIAGMLTRTSSYILGGTMSIATTDAGAGIRTGNIAWDANGTVNAGSGVAITAKGIVGANNGVVTFSIDGSTGAATFNGSISGASGTFSGSVVSGGQIIGQGSSAISVGGVALAGAIIGVSNGTNHEAITGYLAGSLSASAIKGESRSTNTASSGVLGTGPRGLTGQTNITNGPGVVGSGNGTGADFHAATTGRIWLGGSGVQIRGSGGLIRMTDSYATDAYMIMATSYRAGSGATGTLGAKLGTNTAMSGWITAKVAGVTVYIPYWT